MSEQLEPPTIFSRNQYVRDKIVTHDAYYAQFVTPQTISRLRLVFGHEELSAALGADEHFNSIPLRTWDAISIRELDDSGPRWWHASRSGSFAATLPFNRAAAAAAAESITRATMTCIAKCAARMIATGTSLGARHGEQQLAAA